ncbi:MAG: sel1 repeat family protein [Victivallales bacterium]|nr:sel1 repeat family protein [Victivallales bacterium]
MAKAVEWWSKSADQGDDEAQFHLGGCYFAGNGVPLDKTKAVKWYRKAAAQGYDSAIKRLQELKQ